MFVLLSTVNMSIKNEFHITLPYDIIEDLFILKWLAVQPSARLNRRVMEDNGGLYSRVNL